MKLVLESQDLSPATTRLSHHLGSATTCLSPILNYLTIQLPNYSIIHYSISSHLIIFITEITFRNSI